MQDYEKDGIHGKILHVDEPAHFCTMSEFVERREQFIKREVERVHFLLLKFSQPDDDADPLNIGNDHIIWSEMKNRHDVTGVNEWHTHQGVVIFSPQQPEAVVATGITMQEHLQTTRTKLGLSRKQVELTNPSGLFLLNKELPAFWTSEISESGHVLILPDNVIHARETLPQGTTKAAGVLHRKWLKDIGRSSEMLSRR